MKAWEEFLAYQEEELGTETVTKWLRPLKVIRFDAGNLYLEAKDSFQAMWFDEHIRPKVVEQLVNNNGRKIKVHLSIGSKGFKPPARTPKGKSTPQASSTARTYKLHIDAQDPLCTFANFVIQKPVEVPVQILIDATESSSPAYNPLYLYGPPGCGKSHLLMAATHALCEKGLKALYVRAETFTENLIGAIRSGEMNHFREAYRLIDCLLIDDVHIFSRKGATQEELFHTFNTLHLAGKQLVLSANCHPQELLHVEPRLVSRFEWGIVLPLETIAMEARGPLLVKKAAAMNYPLHTKVQQFLVETFTSSPKSLMKALEALILRSHLNQDNGRLGYIPMTVPLAKHYLADLIGEEEQAAITPQKVVQAMAEHYGIPIEDIMGKAQTRDCAVPRQIAMWICRNSLKMPFTKIGQLFERDHSTVMTSVKNVQKEMDKADSEIGVSVGKILKKLQRNEHAA